MHDGNGIEAAQVDCCQLHTQRTAQQPNTRSSKVSTLGRLKTCLVHCMQTSIGLQQNQLVMSASLRNLQCRCWDVEVTIAKLASGPTMLIVICQALLWLLKATIQHAASLLEVHSNPLSNSLYSRDLTKCSMTTNITDGKICRK